MNIKILFSISLLLFEGCVYCATISTNDETGISSTDSEKKTTSDLLTHSEAPVEINHETDSGEKILATQVEILKPKDILIKSSKISDPLVKESDSAVVKEESNPIEIEVKDETHSPQVPVFPNFLKSSFEENVRENKANDSLLDVFTVAGFPAKVDIKLSESDSIEGQAVVPEADLKEFAAKIIEKSKSDAIPQDSSTLKKDLSEETKIEKELVSLSKEPLTTKSLMENKNEVANNSMTDERSPTTTLITTKPFITLPVPLFLSAPVSAPESPSTSTKSVAQHIDVPIIDVISYSGPMSDLNKVSLDKKTSLKTENLLLPTTQEEIRLFVVDKSKNIYKTCEGDIVRLEILQKKLNSHAETFWVKVSPHPFPAKEIIGGISTVTHKISKKSPILPEVFPQKSSVKSHSATDLLRTAKNIRYINFASSIPYVRQQRTSFSQPRTHVNFAEKEKCSLQNNQLGRKY